MRADGYEQYAAIADLYDYVVPYRTRTDVAFFVDAARESGGPVLEVGCGTGRVLIPTAHAGIDITGLDRSTHMLAVALRQTSVRVHLPGRARRRGRDVAEVAIDRAAPRYTARRTMAESLPPKPSDVDTAHLSRCSRASLATTSTRHSSSVSEW